MDDIEQQQTDDQGSDYQQCHAAIESLEQRVATIEKRLGIQSPEDQADPLKQSIAASRPFGAGNGQAQY